MNWTKDYQRGYKHKKLSKKTPKTKFNIYFADNEGGVHNVEVESYSIHHAMNEYSEESYSEELQKLLNQVRPKEVKVVDELLKETHIFNRDEASGRYFWVCEEVDELMKGDE